MKKFKIAAVGALVTIGAAALYNDGLKNQAPMSSMMNDTMESAPVATPTSRPIVVQEDADTCTLNTNSGGTLVEQGEALDRCGDALPSRSSMQPSYIPLPNNGLG